jgi:ATP diphosphatase
MADNSSIGGLLEIMRRLRDPDNGCPWDLQQDARSIARYAIEEACELADAIESDRGDEVRDELGDLLFQVVFHAQLASEQNRFRFDDVVQAISEKMIRRHPHVFGDARVDNAAEQTLEWERHKQQERGHVSSLLDGIATSLPALSRADKLQSRAARAGFDWPHIEGVFDKVNEELAEFRDALDKPAEQEAIIAEAGDLLFAVVNLLRHAGLDAESALRSGNRKFERRFRALEQKCAADGRAVNEAGMAVLEGYWQEVKLEELD